MQIRSKILTGLLTGALATVLSVAGAGAAAESRIGFGGTEFCTGVPVGFS